jgi:methyl-accepting chemotaxis protein
MARGSVYRTASLLAVVLVSAGCGGDSSDALDKDEAAQQYEQLVDPFNDALSDLNDELTTTPVDLADVSEAAQRYVSAAEELHSGLEQQDWPDEVSDDVVDLSAALKRMIPAGQSLVDDSSVDELTTDLPALADSVDDGSAPAGAIRTKLGLEDAPTLS